MIPHDFPAVTLPAIFGVALTLWAIRRSRAVVPLLAALLGVPTGDRYPPLTLTPSGERWFEAKLYRLNGELSLGDGDRAAAEACFQRAIAFARDQSARLWQLRATTSLARLWADQGKRAEASGLLVPIHGWFTEGFDTPDLRDAKALLDELT